MDKAWLDNEFDEKTGSFIDPEYYPPVKKEFSVTVYIAEDIEPEYMGVMSEKEIKQNYPALSPVILADGFYSVELVADLARVTITVL